MKHWTTRLHRWRNQLVAASAELETLAHKARDPSTKERMAEQAIQSRDERVRHRERLDQRGSRHVEGARHGNLSSCWVDDRNTGAGLGIRLCNDMYGRDRDGPLALRFKCRSGATPGRCAYCALDPG